MTRILLLSDIHNQEITLKSILQRIDKVENQPDVCLIAGDITNFGTAQDLQNILNLVAQHIPKTLYIIGNCDPIVDPNHLDTTAISVESQFYEFGFFCVVGFGTAKPQFDHKKLLKMKIEKKNVCLLTHVPPFGTAADIESYNRHVGSRQLKDVIEKNENIFLSVCGHIHDSTTISRMGNCTIVNPGSVTVGNFAIIDLQKDLKIEGRIYNLHEL